MRSFISFSAICLLLAGAVVAHVPHEGANPSGHHNSLSMEEPATSVHPHEHSLAAGGEHTLSTENLQAREPGPYPPTPLAAHNRAAFRHTLAADSHKQAVDAHLQDYQYHKAMGNHEAARNSLNAALDHHRSMQAHDQMATMHRDTARKIRINNRLNYSRPSASSYSSPSPYASGYPSSHPASLRAYDHSEQAHTSTQRANSLYPSSSSYGSSYGRY